MAERDVSRETDEPDASIIASIFGPNGDVIRAYADALTGIGIERGMLGPREAGRVWSRHILNCAVVAGVAPRGASVVDVGSGAGLPGLVWAIARPDLRMTLVDSLRRRTDYLGEVVARLGLANVTVIRSRAEDLAGSIRYQVVTARAVAPLDRLVAWTVPLCEPGGQVVAFKGDNASSELKHAAGVLASFEVESASVETFGHGVTTPPVTVIRLQSARG